MYTMTVSVPARFNGPPGMGNGGITSSLVASKLEGPVEVRLASPTPLDTDLTLEGDESQATLRHDGRAIASARRSEAHPAELPPPLTAAEIAGFQPIDPDLHPFPTCFVCGHERTDGLGLVIRPLGSGQVATLFDPKKVVDPGERIPDRFLWGALDCPSGWAALADIGPGVLGTMNAEILNRPLADAPLVVTAMREKVDGRKVLSKSAIYDLDGDLIASATTTWITFASEQEVA